MLKLLVVDDEAEICDFLKDFFEQRHFKVNTAMSGEDALRKIESEQPDICLLDIKLPGMDGMQVLKEIKRKYPRIKTIMVTALETTEKIQEAVRMGADNYITKPLSLEYLETDVRDKLESLAK